MLARRRSRSAGEVSARSETADQQLERMTAELHQPAATRTGRPELRDQGTAAAAMVGAPNELLGGLPSAVATSGFLGCEERESRPWNGRSGCYKLVVEDEKYLQLR
eukprot:s1301_g16.t1